MKGGVDVQARPHPVLIERAIDATAMLEPSAAAVAVREMRLALIDGNRSKAC
jgi:hypothetical protein